MTRYAHSAHQICSAFLVRGSDPTRYVTGSKPFGLHDRRKSTLALALMHDILAMFREPKL